MKGKTLLVLMALTEILTGCPPEVYVLVGDWDFESGQMGEWRARPGSGITDLESHGGNYAGMMLDNGSSNLAEFWVEFSPINGGKVDFYLYPSDGPSGVGISLADDQGTDTNPNHRFYCHVFPEDGSLRWKDHAGTYHEFATPTDLALDRFSHVVIEWTADADTASVTVNGKVIGDMGILYAGDKVSEFRLQSGSTPATGDQAFIDDVRLYSLDDTLLTAAPYGFEAGELGDWQAHPDSGVSDLEAYKGTYSGMMLDDGSSNLAELWVEFASVQEGKADFWLLPSTGPSGVGVSLADDQGSDTYPNHRFYCHVFPADGSLLWKDQTGTYREFSVPTNLRLDGFSHLVIAWDAAGDTAAVYVNGRFIGDMGILNPGDGISEFRLQSGSTPATGDQAFIDEVKLFSKGALVN